MRTKNTILFTLFCFISIMGATAESRPKKRAEKEQYAASVPKPTLSEIAYGDHARHVLDFWKAESDQPTPLVFVIHGGGWKNGSKERLARLVDTVALLKEGISVVAINYRLMRDAEDVEPPVKAPLVDAARALQFVRSKAKEWNIDKSRIAQAVQPAPAQASGCSTTMISPIPRARIPLPVNQPVSMVPQ